MSGPFLTEKYLKTFLEMAWQEGFEELGKKIADKLSIKNKIAKILFPGIAPGIQTVPFLNGFIEACPVSIIEIWGIDNSEIGLEYTAKLFKEAIGKNEKYIHDNLIKWASDINIERKQTVYNVELSYQKEDNPEKILKIHLINGDLNYWHDIKKNVKFQVEFNLIPCFFILHYLYNWQELFTGLTEILSKNGEIIFVESQGIQKVLTEEPFIESYDNKHEYYVAFWNSFWNEVKGSTFFSSRELTDSNYSVLKRYIKQFYSNKFIIQKVPEYSIISELEFGLKQMVKWIMEGILVYNRMGSRNYRREVSEKLSNNYKGKNVKFISKREFNFSLVKRYNYE